MNERIHCAKCAKQGTRAHHRMCRYRGEGHRNRRHLVELFEGRARMVCLVVHIRRGRKGKGLSLPAAERRVYRRLHDWGLKGSRRALLEVAEGYLRCGATIEEPSPGRAIIRPKGKRPVWLLEEAERLLSEEVPAHIHLTVEQAQCGSVDEMSGANAPICTEPAGHSGDHVAPIEGTIAARWPNIISWT